MAKIVTITNPLTGQPAQVDQLDHTAQQIDDAISRALPGGAIDTALQKKQYYLANGVLLNGSSEIRGTGTATVCIDTNGIARVDFSIKITAASTDSSSFDYGISPALLTSINANIPYITPMHGGVLTVMRDGVLIDSINGYGAYLTAGNNGKWAPTRLYTVDGTAGIWGSTMFAVNDVLVGTCYGTVN